MYAGTIRAPPPCQTSEVASLKGQLLVAAPTLLDPNFSRTVVLIAEHSPEGALGVVLNRGSDLAVADSAPELDDLVEPGDAVFVGGPVEPSGIVVLAEFEDPGEAVAVAFSDIGFLGESRPAAGTRRARVFAGHAGWAPGQLDAEIAGDGWILDPATREDVFASEPDGLWNAVLARKGGRYALLSRMPADPRMN